MWVENLEKSVLARDIRLSNFPLEKNDAENET